MSDLQLWLWIIAAGVTLSLVLLLVLLRRLAALAKLQEKLEAIQSALSANELARKSDQELLIARLGEVIEQKQRLLSDSLREGLGENQKRIADSVQLSLKNTTDTLNQRFAELSQMAERRLDTISGKVDERLSQGFEKTQKVFADVLTRLAVIDKAQERIAELSENVVSLQDVLADKRARGAFGEIQLHQLVRQALPDSAYELQATLSNGRRADCLLKLPEPVGNMVIDAKFPLENYQASVDPERPESERRQATSQFKQDVRKHILDIAERYILPGETTDAAMMFMPSEAIFAELHARHPDLVALAHQRHVWMASPTTMMAILTTIASALKDAETREQVHIIQQHLAELAKDFERFGQRFDKLATHIRQANEDTQQIHVSAKKISQRFSRIEQVDLEAPEALDMPDDQDSE
jgi:DNA recombination protein RmuC